MLIIILLWISTQIWHKSGFSIAKQLAYLGCTVIIGSRSKNSNKLQLAADKINSFIKSLPHQIDNNISNKCIAIKIDVRSSKSIENFFNILTNKYNIKMIDYLINNAGGQYMSELSNISENGWKVSIIINIFKTIFINLLIY